MKYQIELSEDDVSIIRFHLNLLSTFRATGAASLTAVDRVLVKIAEQIYSQGESKENKNIGGDKLSL